MTLSPAWMQRAGDLMREASFRRGKSVSNFLQSNMIDYSKQWNSVISNMFGNAVGSSLDYPNLYRKVSGSDAKDYNGLWFAKVQEARAAGIQIEVIALPNAETLRLGAERFYSYFVEDLQIRSFQVNTPFPGGKLNGAKLNLTLESDLLSRFFRELADIWIDHGYEKIRVGPLDQLTDYFLHNPCAISCMWRPNCVDEFLCMDARGFVAQCDCWVTSYPSFRFGNIYESQSLSELLMASEARQKFRARPALLMRNEDCAACEFLALCHGGCPVRTYTIRGDLFRKDPYCEFYKSLFEVTREKATLLAQRRSASNPRSNDPIW